MKRLLSGATRSWARFVPSSSGLADRVRARSSFPLGPGVGKTVLREEGVSQAMGNSHRSPPAPSVEAETSLSFTALSDLVASVLDEVASALPPLRRRALEVALLLTDPGVEAPNPRAIGLALLDVLRTLAEKGPVLIALDDLQWIDPSSAGPCCRLPCDGWAMSPSASWRPSVGRREATLAAWSSRPPS